jgi:hypothetical protein
MIGSLFAVAVAAVLVKHSGAICRRYLTRKKRTPGTKPVKLVSFSDDEFVIGPCRSTATHDQCCGTVTIYYGSGSGSGSDF